MNPQLTQIMVQQRTAELREAALRTAVHDVAPATRRSRRLLHRGQRLIRRRARLRVQPAASGSRDG